MADQFDFHYLQLRYIREAMNDYSTFRPDDFTVAQVDALLLSAKNVRTAYENTRTEFDLAMGGRNGAQTALHDACVQVYPIMKSRFRKDPVSSEVIGKLPVDDKTPADTLKRGQAISLLWGKLPNPPGSATPFKAWDTMDNAAFAALVTALDTKLETFTDETDDFQEAQGNLHLKDAEMTDFITAALTQGRNQFSVGTAEREVIDAIPTTPASQAPGQAVISAATSPGAGAAHLEYSAPHGTSYDVLRKGPGDAGFATVASDTIETAYDASGLAAGAHQFKVVGRNSRGTGPESAVSTVNVS